MQFNSKYWQDVEEQAAYPELFVKALTEAGLAAALIPEQYGRRRIGNQRSGSDTGGDKSFGG